jgi:hypothetical protein
MSKTEKTVPATGTQHGHLLHWLSAGRHWLLRGWYAVISVVVAALLGNILLVPLAQQPKNWGPGVATQVSTVIALVRTYPLPASATLVLVILVTVLALCSTSYKSPALQRHNTTNR